MSNSKSQISDPSLVTGEQLANHYDEFFGPLYFEPFAVEVAKRIDPSEVAVALEIASGTGRVTHHIRERLFPTATLIASDISEKMLEVAKKKLSRLNIRWQYIDAQQLPFEDNSVDLVICCFGYMFVSDKSTAFAEVYRVLRTGGHFIFTTWDKLENNPASLVSTNVVKEILKDPLPASYELPTSMHEENELRSYLSSAGFSKSLVENVKLVSSCPTAKEAALGFVSGGGIYDEVRKQNPASLPGIQAKLEKEFADRFGTAPMHVPISALIAQGWAVKKENVIDTWA